VSGNVLPQEETSKLSSTTNKVKQTVSELNSFVQNIQRSIQFSVHDETGQSVITVTDKDSGDVIRSFPSEKVLEIAAYLAENKAQADDSVRGLLVNDSA
jgi:flagellar protein FlaG